MAQHPGEINTVNEIIDLHYQLHRLSCILDQVIGRSGIAIHPADLAAADAAAISFVQKKFPALSIQKR
jgi:hypothetical protein